MLTVTAIFEKESGLDAIDPLGDLIISDGYSTITLQTTYLDSWLASLILAYEQTREAGRTTVQVSEEPFQLQIVNSNGLLTISYGDQSLGPQPRQMLEMALRETSESFLNAVLVLPGSDRNRILEPIRRFVAGVANP